MAPTPCSSGKPTTILRQRLRAWVAGATLAVGAFLLGPMPVQATTLLFDFGADATQTLDMSTGSFLYWNNLTTGYGADDAGQLAGLILTDGSPTDLLIQMVSRFNGANESGTTGSATYPASATRDSLFGNTEIFGGLENISPVFKLGGLAPGATYTLTFYASRTGVADNRETRFTVTGATAAIVDLDPANNVTNAVKVAGMVPDGAGEITVALTPGPNNNNANHFTYLGVLEIQISTGGRLLVDFGGAMTTEFVAPKPDASWNNITTSLGSDSAGFLPDLLATNGTVTTVAFQMVSRFNAANSNGATATNLFPVTASQDSLYGNTASFNGLANVAPVFKLTGLKPDFLYSFNFYGSRTGVSDNRETRYTVTGANTAFGDLNTANNVDATVDVANIRPNASGEITVALTPGPNNNNGSGFIYLGAMRVDSTPVRTPRLLVDFGAVGSPTEYGSGDPDNYWNNITTTVGSTDGGLLPGLIKTDGAATPIGLQMVARFNGANENGVTVPPSYVASATRDSLYGNTESFNSLENIAPVFKLTGLDPAVAYDLSFYASRTGVGDNRDTRYTVTGATEVFADLSVANNESASVAVTGMKPTAAGEITIALTPGPNNDNGNHFTYLGVLQVDWVAPAVAAQPTLSAPSYAAGMFSLTLTGSTGGSYRIQRTRTFAGWDDVQTITLNGTSQTVQIPQAEPEYFYRAVTP